MAQRLSKTTKKQYEELYNCVSTNRIVLSGKTKPLEYKKIDTLWKQFTEEINKKGYGTPKSVEQWRHVFKEWKANTKRKSRFIEANRNKTGGGPVINKVLTDLEEKLLSLISKIHLGDTELVDTLAMTDVMTNVDTDYFNNDHIYIQQSFSEPEARNTNEHILEVNLGQAAAIEVVTENNDKEIEISRTSNDENQAPMKRKTKCTAKVNNLKESRYTTSLLKNATENYMDAQKLNVASEKIKAEIKEKSKLDVERKRNKLEYCQIFGNLEGYDEF